MGVLWLCLRRCVDRDVHLCNDKLWALQYNTPTVLHTKLWNYFCKLNLITSLLFHNGQAMKTSIYTKPIHNRFRGHESHGCVCMQDTRMKIGVSVSEHHTSNQHIICLKWCRMFEATYCTFKFFIPFMQCTTVCVQAWNLKSMPQWQGHCWREDCNRFCCWHVVYT